MAVFVDAGYLFAQGSVAITGAKKPRHTLVLDPQEAIKCLKALAEEKASACSLLRIYWYDGVDSSGRPSADQSLLAESNDVKLRLGLINSHGQQKGVDSLIVTDLIELARQKSICDALLVSGDEDIRVGVQIAQTYGVRVHLLGLHPSRSSQSRLLMQEADTATEWMPDLIARFLSMRAEPAKESIVPSAPKAVQNRKLDSSVRASREPDNANDGSMLAQVAMQAASELIIPELQGLNALWQTDRGVPQDIDKRLLGLARNALGRILATDELKDLRLQFRKSAKDRIEIEANQEKDPIEPNT